MADKQDIDDLLNYINQEDETTKKKKKKKSKKNKKDSTTTENNNNNNNKETKEEEKEKEEPKIENNTKISETEQKEKHLSKKEEKQKQLFLKYLPTNINTDTENESCSKKPEFRENKYRDLIKPSPEIAISTKRFQDNSHLRLIGNWEEGPCTQTNPPTKSIDEQYNCLDDYPV